MAGQAGPLKAQLFRKRQSQEELGTKKWELFVRGSWRFQWFLCLQLRWQPRPDSDKPEARHLAPKVSGVEGC